MLGFNLYQLYEALNPSTPDKYSFYINPPHGFTYGDALPATISSVIANTLNSTTPSPLIKAIMKIIPQATINNLAATDYASVQQYLSVTQQTQRNAFLNLPLAQVTMGTAPNQFVIQYSNNPGSSANFMKIKNSDGFNNDITLNFSDIGNDILQPGGIKVIPSLDSNASSPGNNIAAGIVNAIANDLGIQSTKVPKNLISLANAISYGIKANTLLPLICPFIPLTTIQSLTGWDHTMIKAYLSPSQEQTFQLAQQSSATTPPPTPLTTTIVTPSNGSFSIQYTTESIVISPATNQPVTIPFSNLVTTIVSNINNNIVNFNAPGFVPENIASIIGRITSSYISKNYITIYNTQSDLVTANAGAIGATLTSDITTGTPNSIVAAIIQNIPQLIINSLSISDFKLITPYLLSSQLGASTTAQITTLTPTQKASFTSTPLTISQLAALTTTTIPTLTTPQIVAILPGQINGMAPNFVRAFTAAQINVMTPDQIIAFPVAPTVQQIPGLTPAQIQKYTPGQIAGLPQDQIQAFTFTQIQALTTNQLNAMKPNLIPSSLAYIQANLSTAQLTATSGFKKSLTIGSTGLDVRRLQDFLTVLDFSVVNNDNPKTFGTDTKKAIQRFQKNHHIPVDGIFRGHSITKANRLIEKTKSAITPFSQNIHLQHGDSGEIVEKLHAFLINRNYLDNYGTFGPATHAAVKQFQRLNNLTADGVFAGTTAETAQSIIAQLRIAQLR